MWRRRVTFTFRGVWLDQDERWYLARGEVDPDDAPLDDVGNDEARWWTRDELVTTDELLAPGAIVEHLDRLLEEGPPTAPIDVGR